MARKVLFTDWVGGEYFSKEEMITAIEKYFDENLVPHDAQDVIEHFSTIFKHCDVEIVKRILALQDEIFCVMD